MEREHRCKYILVKVLSFSQLTLLLHRKAMSKWNHLSFFKILVGDHVFTKLKVPPAFLKNLKGINFPTQSTISLKSGPKLSWKVKMERMECGGVYFTKGWEKLWKDIKLQIGDFLVFYLVVGLDKDASFQLRAFDKTCCDKMRLSSTSPLDKNKSIESDDEPTSKKSKQNTNCGKIASSAAQKGLEFKSKYPFFQKAITTACLSSSKMRLPTIFSKSYLNGVCKNQTLTFETGCGQSWQVTLRENTLLCTGLSRFLNDNFVKLGNICTFELIDSNRMLFKVYINRGSHDQIPQSSAEKPDFSNVSAPRLGSGLASEYPFFQVDITTYLVYHSILAIPWAFAKANLNTERNSQTVTLETGGGGSWLVKLAIYSNPNRARLCSGISAFMQENNVKVGNILTLELVDKIDMVFRVSIYKG